MKFLEAFKLDSNRASGLLNLGVFPALLKISSGSSQDLFRIFFKCLKKTSIYRSLGVDERHMAEPNW